MKEEKKSTRVELRLTQQEKEALEHHAAKCGISLSAYIRRCCMD